MKKGKKLRFWTKNASGGLICGWPSFPSWILRFEDIVNETCVKVVIAILGNIRRIFRWSCTLVVLTTMLVIRERWLKTLLVWPKLNIICNSAILGLCQSANLKWSREHECSPWLELWPLLNILHSSVVERLSWSEIINKLVSIAIPQASQLLDLKCFSL